MAVPCCKGAIGQKCPLRPGGEQIPHPPPMPPGFRFFSGIFPALSLHLSPVGFPLPAGRFPASPRRGGRSVPNVPNGLSGFLFCTRSGQQSVTKNNVLPLCKCGLCTKCTKSTKCTKFSVCTKTGCFHNSFTFGALLWTFSWKRLTLMTLMTLFPHSTINNVYSLFICVPTQTPHHDFIMTKMTLL